MHRTVSVLHLIPICRLPKTLHDLGPLISLTSSLFTVPLYGDLAVCHWHLPGFGAIASLVPLSGNSHHQIGTFIEPSPGSSHLSPTTAWPLLCPLLASVFALLLALTPLHLSHIIFFYLICIFESFPIASSCSKGIPKAMPYTPKTRGRVS